MRRILVLVVFALAIPSLISSAQTDQEKPKPTAPAAQQMSSVEQEIAKLDRELMDATVRNDPTLMQRVALDRYVFINPVGGVQERGDTQGPKIESIQTEDVQVRVHGDTAILIGRANVKGKFPDGPDISGPYRYMRVFVKQQGQWRLAAVQVTPIASSVPAPAATPTP
ncbi:MAG TPA: nuclear transport factor 2 family protein [Pyrinomonadaceae bacterium]|nr:nuclear transport factor 2 family protein [Pyrinomonadaceae bacterium]